MKSVVIVEDDVNIALAEKAVLEEFFDVSVAHDGLEGWELIKEKKPDVAVLDVMMPKLDGFELCKRLREDPELSGLRIVMVTAKNQDVDEDYGMRIGADDYIMKPFEADELLHVVNQVLKG